MEKEEGGKKYLSIQRYRWTKEEKGQILDQLLREAVPFDEEPPGLITAAETLEDAQKIIANGDKLVGVSSGYRALDDLTKGFAPGDLIIVYGDTSHGKSQLTQNIAYRVAKRGEVVMFIGLEMINAQNTARFVQIAHRDPERDGALGRIIYPLVNDLRYENIEAHIEQAVGEGAQLVVIDQLQQLTRSKDNVTNETSIITHEIKRMAVRYEIPIVLISHINRSGSKMSAPTLAELKGSSSIEQDADICLAVWRDIDPRNEAMDQLEVWQRKNRNRGGLGQHITLRVENEVGLREENAIEAIFPGAQTLAL